MSETETKSKGDRFAIIAVIGAPGAGKGTLCAYLAAKYSFRHYSVGDGLREWMRDNRDAPLAATIQDKLENQGFLSSEDLNPFIQSAVHAARAENKRGILIDGYPRCSDQMLSFDVGGPDQHHDPKLGNVPDLVLALNVDKSLAQARYVGRARDQRDSLDKFEKRYAEYRAETVLVEFAYRERRILIDVDANGTKEENVAELERQLGRSALWKWLW